MAPVSLILSRVGRISWAPADPASPSMIAKARSTDVIAVATDPSTVFLGPVALRNRRSARLHAYGPVEPDRLAFGARPVTAFRSRVCSRVPAGRSRFHAPAARAARPSQLSNCVSARGESASGRPPNGG